MNITDCYLHITDRLNSLSSNSGDKIPKHTFVRAFNAAQNLWVEDRYKLNGSNNVREEELQVILTNTEFTPKKQKFSEGDFQVYYYDLPLDFLHSERALTIIPCSVFLYRKKEEEVNRLLSDEFWKPSLEWAESFYTIGGNKIKIYSDFTISKVNFVYYRTPVQVNMEDGFLGSTGELNTNIDPEFQNSSLIEILNLTTQLLASDTTDNFRLNSSGNLNNRYT